MRLLIDIGNTRLKWAVVDQHCIVQVGSLINKSADFVALIQQWQSEVRPQLIGITCVNSPQLVALVRSVAASLWPGCPVHEVKTTVSCGGVLNAYVHAEKLGVDRWMALVAARRLYLQAACIVDCGTAITIDVIDGNGCHQGGMISPGLSLMRQSLAQGTHRLPFTGQPFSVGLADHTEAGIYNGVLCAACGLIERVMTQYASGLLLILTGGDAPLIAQQLSCKSLVEDNLVLLGLNYVLDDTAKM